MANQIFGRYPRCCRTFLRLMAITRRPSLQMQTRCTYGTDAKDGDKGNKKNITGDQSAAKAVDSHKTEGNARTCSEQDKQTKTKNILLNNTLKVHAIYENKFQEKPSNIKDDLQKTAKFSESENKSTRTEPTSNKTVTDRMSKDKLGLHHSEPLGKNVSEKQKIENMSKELQAKIESDEKKTIGSLKITQDLKNTAISTENQMDKNTQKKRTVFKPKTSVSDGMSTESKDNAVSGKLIIENIINKSKAKSEFDKKKVPVDSSKLTQDSKKDVKSTESHVDKIHAKRTDVTSSKSVSDGISTESKDKVQQRLGQVKPSANTVSGKRINESQANPEIDKIKQPTDSSKITQDLKKDATDIISKKSVLDGMSAESKNKAQLSLVQGEPSDKQIIENNSIKLQEKTQSVKTKEPIELINIIRGQCDIIEKLKSKFNKSSQFADKNNMKVLNNSEATEKSSANNDKLETIKIMGGIPDTVEKAKKARNSKISQRKNDTNNNRKLESVQILGGIPNTDARKTGKSKVSQRISEKTIGQVNNNKTGKKKIRGMAFSGTKPTEIVKAKPIGKPIDQTDTKSASNNEQLKSMKSFNLSYISQQDIDKWKKMESDALNEGKSVAMSVDKIPQSHLAKTLGKDFRMKNKYFTFDQILSMTDKKFVNKRTESKALTESNPRVGNADIKDKKDTLSFEKTKEPSELASKKEAKDQKETSLFKENPKTLDKMDEHMTFPKTLNETSDRFNTNPHKSSEIKALHYSEITMKTTGDNITQSTNNEFTKVVEPVDLTKKPLRGTVAVLLEANNRKRMEELNMSFNLQNEETDNATTYRPIKFVDQSQENMAQNQSQKDIVRPTPAPSTKNEKETVEFSKSESDQMMSESQEQKEYINSGEVEFSKSESDQMISESQEQKEYINSVEVKSATPDASRDTLYSFTPNSNSNALATTEQSEQSYEEKLNETVNPNIKAQSAIDVMISKINEQKKLLSSEEVKSATLDKDQNTPYSYTAKSNLNAADTISELKKKIESIKKSENMFVSDELSSPIDMERNFKPTQFSSSDLNVNVNNSEIKSDCSLTPGDLYHTHNETITCDTYTESEKSGSSHFKSNEDILPKRWREKSKEKIKTSTTGNEPESDTYKEHNSDESEKNEDNSNDPDLNFFEPMSKKKRTEEVGTDNNEGFKMIDDDKTKENEDIEPDLYFSEPKDNPEDNQKQAAKDDISFADFFSQKLKDLYKLDEGKIENPKQAPPTPKETPKEENKAQLYDNLKETPKMETKAQPHDRLKETPKEDDKAQLKPEKVLAAEAKKTLSDYLLTLVNGKNKPGSKRDFGTYSLAQNFSSSVFPRYWPPLYWKIFTNRLSELIKKQPTTDVFISPDLKNQCLRSQVIVKKRLEMWKILSGVNNIKTKPQNSIEVSEGRNSKIQIVVQEIRDKRFAHVNRLVSIRRMGRS